MVYRPVNLIFSFFFGLIFLLGVEVSLGNQCLKVYETEFGGQAHPAYKEAEKKATQTWTEFTKWMDETEFSSSAIEGQLKQIENTTRNRERRAKIVRSIDKMWNFVTQGKSDSRLLRYYKLKENKQETLEAIHFFHIRELGRAHLPKETESKMTAIWRDLFGSLWRSKSLEHLTPNLETTDKLKSQVSSYIKDEYRVWIEAKFDEAFKIIPQEIIDQGGMSKMVKVMAGVMGYCIDEIDFKQPKEVIETKVFKAIQAGYYFGLTYPLVDDVMDSKAHLSQKQKKTANDLMIRGLSGEKILDSEVPNHDIAKELKKIFDSLNSLMPYGENRTLYDSLLVLAVSQTLDGELGFNKQVPAETVFVPAILKAAYSRIVAMQMGGRIDDSMADHALMVGLFNQLTDDYRDFTEDLAAGNLTAFTYYYHHSKSQSDFPNPLELLLRLPQFISEKMGTTTPQKFFLKRIAFQSSGFAKAHGEEKFREFLELFGIKNTPMEARLIALSRQRWLVNNDLDSVGFKKVADKLSANQTRKEYDLKGFIKAHKPLVDSMIEIDGATEDAHQRDLVNSMNYSLRAGGKRLRPMLALMTADLLGIPKPNIFPLVKTIERLHTASLMLDDLPAQDNAARRRGQATNHIVFKESTTQLASLSLVASAFEEIAALRGDFSAEKTLAVLKYISQSVGHEGLSLGQAKDLGNQNVTLEQLTQMTHLKTGLAIESSMVSVAIVGGATAEQIEAIKAYSFHLGLVFQIRDDILDVIGDSNLTGKDVNIDFNNQTTTYTTLLGLRGAQAVLAQHQASAHAALKKFTSSTKLLHEVIDYAAERDQ